MQAESVDISSDVGCNFRLRPAVSVVRSALMSTMETFTGSSGADYETSLGQLRISFCEFAEFAAHSLSRFLR